MLSKIAFGLGSNLGDSPQNIHDACRKLTDNGLCEIKLSPLYRSTPVDCPQDSETFTNAAATALWPGTAEELLEISQQIELDMGRPERRAINAPRPIDIDILIFGEDIIEKRPQLIVPHERMLERDFVLRPLADIWPDLIIPGTGLTIEQAVNKLTDDQNAIC